MKRCLVTCSSNQSKETNFEHCCEEIKAEGKNPILLIFFSDEDDLWYYAKELHEAFPEATSIGSTTFINFSSVGLAHSGLSVMAIFSGIECSAGLLFEVDRHPRNYILHIKEALKNISTLENTCCMEFTTPFMDSEELVLDTFKEAFKGMDIPLFGGSAGTSDSIKKGFVALNGDIYQNTCAFVFIHNQNGKIHLYKENIFERTLHQFIATDVDCEERKVYEYDDQPAADVLAKALNVDLEDLPEVLPAHPMGRIVNNEIFITESNKIYSDGSISYFSRVYNHTKMVLLEVSDFETVWKETAEEIHKVIPAPSFSVSIHCFSRTKLFEKENKLYHFISTLKANYGDFIGLSGFGEQLGFIHLNQSMVIAVFE